MDFGNAKPVNHDLFGMIFLTNDPDHFINIEISNQIAIEEMEPFLNLIETELRPAHHHFAAVIEIGPQHLAQTHDLRRPLVQDVHVQAKARLKITNPEQAFHKHVGFDCFGARLEDEANIFRTLIADICEQRCFFRLNQVGEAFNQF